jgi:hypothetical protein
VEDVCRTSPPQEENGAPSAGWGSLRGGSLSLCDDFYRFQVTGGGGDGRTVTPSDATGTGAASIQSQHPLSHVLPDQDVAASGFGAALWLSLPSKSNGTSSSDAGDGGVEAPILTLGRLPSPEEDLGSIPPWAACGERFDLDVSYHHLRDEIVVRYADRADQGGGADLADDDDDKPPADRRTRLSCRTLRFGAESILPAGSGPNPNPSVPSPSVHLMIVFSPQNLLVYGSGRSLATVPWSTDLTSNITATNARPPPPSYWNATADHLVLLRDGTFQGGLHQVDFFLGGDQVYWDRHVPSLYAEGFAKPMFDAARDDGGGDRDADALVQLDPLQVRPNELPRIPQDATSPLSLELGGMVRWRRNVTSVVPASSAGVVFGLRVNVTRIPAHGIVRLPHSSRSIERGDALDLALTIEPVAAASLAVEYVLTDKLYYNMPPADVIDDEDERLEAVLSVVWQGNVLASEPVRVPIQVQQVNFQPPSLVAPSRIVTSNSTIVVLSNVTLGDPDAGSARTPVRVDVSSKHSPLTFILDEQGSYDDTGDVKTLSDIYETCRRRSDSPWQCTGASGTSAEMDNGFPSSTRTIVFVAPMHKVPFVLESLISLRLDQKDDALTIRVYDGQDDGNCLSPREQALYGSNWTIHRGCFVAEASIELSLDPNMPFPAAQSGGGIASADAKHISRLANSLFWGLMIVVSLCIIACLRRFLPRCLVRGPAIDADGDEIEAGYRAERGAKGSFVDPTKSLGSPARTLEAAASDDEFDDVASF